MMIAWHTCLIFAFYHEVDPSPIVIDRFVAATSSSSIHKVFVLSAKIHIGTRAPPSPGRALSTPKVHTKGTFGMFATQNVLDVLRGSWFIIR